jgi:hypothetical protein
MEGEEIPRRSGWQQLRDVDASSSCSSGRRLLVLPQCLHTAIPAASLLLAHPCSSLLIRRNMQQSSTYELEIRRKTSQLWSIYDPQGNPLIVVHADNTIHIENNDKVCIKNIMRLQPENIVTAIIKRKKTTEHVMFRCVHKKLYGK